MAGTWFLSHTAYERVTLALASVVLLALPHPAAVATRAIPTTRTPTVPVSTSIYPSVVASGTRHRRRPCLAVRSRSEFELMMVSMESLSSGPGAEPVQESPSGRPPATSGGSGQTFHGGH